MGIDGDYLREVICGRDADGADATDIADVAAGLDVAVDERSDELELWMLNDGGDRVAADGSGGPLNDAQHAEELTVRTTRRLAP